MKPHEQRVVDEKAELDDRIEKLNTFTRSNPLYDGLDDENKCLLMEQLSLQMRLSMVLGRRIALFPKEETKDANPLFLYYGTVAHESGRLLVNGVPSTSLLGISKDHAPGNGDLDGIRVYLRVSLARLRESGTRIELLRNGLYRVRSIPANCIVGVVN